MILTAASSPDPARDPRPAADLRLVPPSDPLVRPLLRELAHEYATRYERDLSAQWRQLSEYPAERFEPPSGALLVLVEGGAAVAGGAFQFLDPETAELKRIWTHHAHRRRGLGRLVLGALEAEAARRGYRRLYLTTGPRQPEAVALYLDTGFRPLYDITLDAEAVGPHPFDKVIGG